jgi:hypothetical protein
MRCERDSSGTTRIYEAHKCQRHAVEAKYMRVMERIARRERVRSTKRSGSPNGFINIKNRLKIWLN